MMSRLYSGLRILVIAATVCYAFTSCSLQSGKDSLVIQKIPSGSSRNIMSDCLKCHSDKTPSIDPLLIGGQESAVKHTVHVGEKNISCLKCHSGYADKSTHMDGILETGNSLIHFDSTNPAGSWTGDTGPGTGSCASLNCHGGETLPWFETQTWTLPACSVCHTSAVGARRQVLGADGDFDRESHHIIDYSDRTNEIVTSSDCIVCHNMDDHMSGTIRLNNEDDSSKVILYDPSDPSTLEPFCLSCHDSDGATVKGVNALSPFSDTNTLGVIPNEAGNKIADYWKSPSNLHKDTGGLTCAGTGEPGTGCHGNNGTINMHGSVNDGLLTGNMNFQIKANADYNANDYELCFSCHANYSGITKEDILGVKKGGNYDYSIVVTPPPRNQLTFGSPPYYTSGIKTKFTDSDAYIHNDGPHKYQLHWFHLSMRVYGDGDVWLYRGQGNPSGCSGCHFNSSPPAGRKASCTACHNVHGSSSPGMTYDELKITHNTGETTGFLGIPREELVNSPMSCGLSECHSGATVNNNYIFNPTGE